VWDIGKGVPALWMRESFGSGVKLRRHAEPASFSFMALLHDLILYFNIYRSAKFVVSLRSDNVMMFWASARSWAFLSATYDACDLAYPLLSPTSPFIQLGQRH